MIRWIQSKQWLSSALIAATFFLVIGGIDFALFSSLTLAVTATVALAVFVGIRFAYLAGALVVVSGFLSWWLGTGLTLSALGIAVVVFLVAVTSVTWVRFAVLGVSAISLAGFVVSEAFLQHADFGSALFASQISTVAAGISAVYFGARIAFTRVVHVGTSLDQRVANREASQLSLRLAEQEERFQIAREITEVILQDVTAVLTQAEGGSYAAKVDPSVAVRVLSRLSSNARSAHQDLRRLYDQLNSNIAIQAAPPGIDDLESQIVLLREYGYTASLTHQGPRFAISEGAGLAIYRLVFDALENVKDHVPAGASVSVDFTWVDEGMQILVKDNGTETANRALNAVAEAAGGAVDTSYDMHDDLEALVQPIVGPSITAMRERAAMYGGAVEVAEVPGVGFTVSAIFPQLRNLAGVAEGI